MFVGVLATPLFVLLAFDSSIHDGFRIAGYLFPYAVLISPTLDSVNLLSLLLTAVQFPLYGFLVGLWWRNRVVLTLCCVLIVLTHCAASIAAERVVENLPIRMKLERDLEIN
jgi:hypothetical protein